MSIAHLVGMGKHCEIMADASEDTERGNGRCIMEFRESIWVSFLWSYMAFIMSKQRTPYSFRHEIWVTFISLSDVLN